MFLDERHHYQRRMRSLEHHGYGRHNATTAHVSIVSLKSSRLVTLPSGGNRESRRRHVLCPSICLARWRGLGWYKVQSAERAPRSLGAPPADACPVLVRFVCTDDYPTERDMTSKDARWNLNATRPCTEEMRTVRYLSFFIVRD